MINCPHREPPRVWPPEPPREWCAEAEAFLWCIDADFSDWFPNEDRGPFAQYPPEDFEYIVATATDFPTAVGIGELVIIKHGDERVVGIVVGMMVAPLFESTTLHVGLSRHDGSAVDWPTRYPS